MDYVRVGSSGLLVSSMIFGGPHLGESLGPDGTSALVRAALDRGITTFYTADSYAGGEAEVALGAALRERRDDVVLMVKAGYRVADLSLEEIEAPLAGAAGDRAALWQLGVSPTSSGLSRKHLMAAVDASLRRLGTDYIDLYQTHFWDRAVPIEETLDTLTDIVRSGKVRYIGCSQTNSWQLYRSLWVSEVRGTQRFQSVQRTYNVFERKAADDLLSAASAAGVGFFAHSSLAAGLFRSDSELSSRPDGPPSRERYVKRFWHQENIQVATRLRLLAAELGRTTEQLAQGWALAQPGVTALLIGPSTEEELRLESEVADRPLSAAELRQITAILEAGD